MTFKEYVFVIIFFRYVLKIICCTFDVKIYIVHEKLAFQWLMLFTNHAPRSFTAAALLQLELLLILFSPLQLLQASHDLLIVEGFGKLQGLDSYGTNFLQFFIL